MTPIIKAEHLSKRYSIGGRQKNASLREAVAQFARAPLKVFGNGNRKAQTIWALDDVSFQIAPGEVVGIIGRNGAGKSTLLKILARVTKPTKGRVTIQGRIGSLLEVGTGFHSELTGRENIYLNGAILGMTRREIDRKFDEIVAFAETEQFLDTPVKHYSSGMTVRLAFAVAAHLEPEILIVDEVLAVGDASFQKKCLGKMNDVAQAGRTILFVSHDIAAVNALCRRSMLLHEGKLVMSGETSEVTRYYLDSSNRLYSPITWVDFSGAETNEEIELQNVEIIQNGSATSAVDCRQPFTIAISYENKQVVPNSRLMIVIRNAKGEILFTTSDYDLITDEARERRTGRFTSRITVPAELLKSGSYFGTVAADIKNERIVFAANDVMQFDVFESGDDTMAERHKRVGLLAPILKWDTVANEIDSSRS